VTDDPRRRIPGVDVLLSSAAFGSLLGKWGRPRVVDAIREAQERLRSGPGPEGGGQGRASGIGGLPASSELGDPGAWARVVERALVREDRPSLRRVVNATGVILHTNLGRAPLAPAAREAMERIAHGYSNLEFDLEGGGRGSRYVHCVELLRDLTGAEDALVVNNGAAALILALNTLARGRTVAVSRGELVEIGGGFRIPEMIERAGAVLAEVGSTNRTRLEDYRRAADDPEGRVAALLKVHRSNFRIRGFTEEATLPELAGLARERELPLVHDLGSGLLAEPASLGLPPEPRAGESLEAGADLVIVSGDKLMGAPQAGIVLGRAHHVAALRSNPLCRALRVDKVTLAGLEATLALYRDPAAARAGVPALHLLAREPGDLRETAKRLASAAREAGLRAGVTASAGTPGGGTYPGTELPGAAVALDPPDGRGAGALARALREGTPPVVGRLESGRLLLDVRTLLPSDEPLVKARFRDLVARGWGESGEGAREE
jgi:L-seryl-tRNA(Ser) seleniumtransferase